MIELDKNNLVNRSYRRVAMIDIITFQVKASIEIIGIKSSVSCIIKSFDDTLLR